jgi:hypothetical protein
VILESTGGWNKQKILAKTKGHQAPVAIDKCISVTTNIKVQILENIHDMECKSEIMYGIEVWRLSEARTELDRFIADFATN